MAFHIAISEGGLPSCAFPSKVSLIKGCYKACSFVTEALSSSRQALRMYPFTMNHIDNFLDQELVLLFSVSTCSMGQI